VAESDQTPDIVGDSRLVRIYSIHPAAPETCVEVGDVWQGDDGALHGTGLAAVMLFEPSSLIRYRSASITMDVSPLTVFYHRIFRSSFFLPEFMEGQSRA